MAVAKPETGLELILHDPPLCTLCTGVVPELLFKTEFNGSRTTGIVDLVDTEWIFESQELEELILLAVVNSRVGIFDCFG